MLHWFRHRPQIVVAICGAAVSSWFMSTLVWHDSSGRLRYVLFDDAMISMSYARTFARGDGLVWYAGAPKVQGFTNPLWTLMMVPFHLVGLSPTPAALAVSAVGALVLIACGWLAVSIVRTVSTSTTLAVVAGVATVTSYALVYWSVRGMEVGAVALASLLLVRGMQIAEPSRRQIALLIVVTVAGVATRMDFVLVGGAVTLALWWLDGRRSSPLSRGLGLATVAGALGIVVCQRIYYGAWFPNTFTLKMSGGPVTERMTAGVDSLLRNPESLVLATLALVLAGATTRRVVVPMSGIAILFCAYDVWVGGDSWEQFSNRYLAVGTVLALVAFVIAAHDALESNRALIAVAVGWCAFSQVRLFVPNRIEPDAWGKTLVAIIVVAAVLSVLLMRSRPWTLGVGLVVVLSLAGWMLDVGRSRVFDHDADRVRIERALLIDSITKPDARIAVASAGTTVYVADRPAVDLLGKSDERIAHLPRRVAFFPGHDKWDLAISIGEERPDVVLELVGDAAEAETVLTDDGYDKVCHTRWPAEPLWVRTDSTLVNRLDLTDC